MTLRNDGRPVFSAHDCNRRGELGIRLTIDLHPIRNSFVNEVAPSPLSAKSLI